MSWERYKKYFLGLDNLGFGMDVSRVDFDDAYLASMEGKMREAFAAMAALEGGAIANPDENRMVGHYWLRTPELAPTPEIKGEIKETVAKIKDFAKKVHDGQLKGADGKFEYVLCIGIGGSALGPQFVSEALSDPKSDKMKVFFLDNTDPDGFDLVFDKLDGKLGKTLAVIASKSGGTPEPRNAMMESISRWQKAGLDFSKHAVVTTGVGSKLYNFAKEKGYLEFFPMWDWVGGRTSEFAAVGLLPAALQGIDIDAMSAGAAAMDAATRNQNTMRNPAALLALMWYKCTGGKGLKDMVILPYKDRLLLFSRYLQQLIMESLGKELDLNGNKVEQGISVYGNKGSTDQHAYVQQLRDGKQMPVAAQYRKITVRTPFCLNRFLRIQAEFCRGGTQVFRSCFQDSGKAFRRDKSPVPPDCRLPAGGKMRKIKSFGGICRFQVADFHDCLQ